MKKHKRKKGRGATRRTRRKRERKRKITATRRTERRKIKPTPRRAVWATLKGLVTERLSTLRRLRAVRREQTAREQHEAAEEERPEVTGPAIPPPLSNRYWLEIRPYPGQDLRLANLKGLVNYAFSTNVVFDFVVANTPSPRDPTMSTVRFFFGCSNSEAAGYAREWLEGQGFYVLVEDPPDFAQSYEWEVDLQMARNFAIAVFLDSRTAGHSWPSTAQEETVDIAGGLASAVMSGGAFRVTFRADRGAQVNVYKTARDMERRPTRGEPGVVSGLIDDLVSGHVAPDGPPRKAPSAPTATELRIKDQARAMLVRADSGLFTCDIRAYGTLGQAGSIISSFPLGPNPLESYKKRKASGELPDPSRHPLGSFLRKVAIVSPFGILPILWRIGAWNPVHLIDGGLGLVPPISAAVVALLIWGVWRPKRPVVLSLPELVQIVSIPTMLEGGRFEFAPEAPPRHSRTDVFAGEETAEGVN